MWVLSANIARLSISREYVQFLTEQHSDADTAQAS